jgi:hypothetical protein
VEAVRSELRTRNVEKNVTRVPEIFTSI